MTTKMLYNMLGYGHMDMDCLQIWKADTGQFLLHEKGLIYEQKHEGWYSVTDECFYPQSQVQPWIGPSTGRKTMVQLESMPPQKTG